VESVSVIEAPTAGPEIAGEAVARPDRIVVMFSGSVILDRNDPRDLELFDRLQLGTDTSLRVEGQVAARTQKQYTQRGENTLVKEEAKVVVFAVYDPPER
jgi:hypothetical protein